MKYPNFFSKKPNDYSRPSYRISPFQTKDISKNAKISSVTENHDDNLLYKNIYSYTFANSGREALYLALENCQLGKDDCVTILSVTNSQYISSCVTDTVQLFCKWNRDITNQTKAIIVIHEFGKQFKNFEEIKSLNLPIIEDFAYSFSSYNRTAEKFIGDYLVFSLSKFFPVQFGGLLLSKTNLSKKNNEFVRSLFLHYVTQEAEIFNARKRTYQQMLDCFSEVSIDPFFTFEDNECPGVFMFKISEKLDTLEKLKKDLHFRGIECSVFYGNPAFFIPCNQNLEFEDIMYFRSSIQDSLKI
tara:strand:- start:2244 stop:3146 length:903 start_codon:yes stop_codon:yes gene_type:complete